MQLLINYSCTANKTDVEFKASQHSSSGLKDKLSRVSRDVTPFTMEDRVGKNTAYNSYRDEPVKKVVRPRIPPSNSQQILSLNQKEMAEVLAKKSSQEGSKHNPHPGNASTRSGE